jgi:hypothetical protein
LKQEKRRKAQETLEDWKATKKREQEARRTRNREEEKDFWETEKQQKNGENPWERVVSNINTKEHAAQKDMSRMKQTIIARKGDIAKGNKKTMI